MRQVWSITGEQNLSGFQTPIPSSLPQKDFKGMSFLLLKKVYNNKNNNICRELTLTWPHNLQKNKT